MIEPPDNIPRSLHDIWYAGYAAADANRPVCRKHKTPKRAHYFCLECREAGESIVRAQAPDIPAAPPATKRPVEDALHDVFTRHGIASRSAFSDGLICDLIHWAADECLAAMTVKPPDTPHDFSMGDGICLRCGIEEAIAGPTCKAEPPATPGSAEKDQGLLGNTAGADAHEPAPRRED